MATERNVLGMGLSEPRNGDLRAFAKLRTMGHCELPFVTARGWTTGKLFAMKQVRVFLAE